jgi:single-stranded-DNA-specific exonuclease
MVADRVSAGTEPAEVVQRILRRRGLEAPERQQQFLHPRLRDLADPLRIPDMERAVERVEAAVKAGESILIYSDYDVDGMSSGALLYRFLRGLGSRVRVFIPERLGEGYGLSDKGLERALGGEGADLVIALDCGTTSHHQVRALRDSDIDVVILDHHELASEPPPAVAFVNPQRGGTDHGLATVGIVFKFCHAFLKLRSAPDLFDLRTHMDLVALGTVADMVPLLDDNRILVSHGLKQLAQTEHIGLRALMDVAGLRKDPTPGTIGFVLGPRLNASGRLAEATAGWELLITEDESNARRIAQDLDTLNRERQRLELDAYREAEAMLEAQPETDRSHCIVVASERWHQGVVGIVASRLQKSRYRPAVVISLNPDGSGKGSARSIEGCSIMDALRSCPSALHAFGGHAMAAGLEVLPGAVDGLRAALNEWFRTHTTEADFQERLNVDIELPGSSLTAELAQSIQSLEPFGQKNQAPLLAVRGVRMERPRVLAERHLRFQAATGRQAFPVIGFGFAGRPAPQGEFDIAGHWAVDDYTGKPCFTLADWQWS